jgi:hypothetical protein
MIQPFTVLPNVQGSLSSWKYEDSLLLLLQAFINTQSEPLLYRQ